jgi:signal transduction histidine kinase
VEVAVSVAEGVGGRTLVFRIADKGRGISPEEREIILDRLASRKRDYSAYRSGIGLFIVKTLSDRYGGKLWIDERVPGDHQKGSVLCIELPVP